MFGLRIISERPRDGTFRRRLMWHRHVLVTVIVEPDIWSWDWPQRNCRRWRFDMMLIGRVFRLGYRYRAWCTGPRLLRRVP